MKRGQGISITVIIVAAVALVVLVVLVAVFSGRIGSFGREIASCQGKCVPASNCTAVAPEGECEQEAIIFRNFWWTSSEELVCCLLTK